MSRKDDENLYQPKIRAKWIRALYRMSRITRLPMAVLVDQALAAFCTASHGGGPASVAAPEADRGSEQDTQADTENGGRPRMATAGAIRVCSDNQEAG